MTRASPSYWADRRRRHKPLLDNGTLRLIREQKGRCPLCGDYLLHADREPNSPHEWEQWLTATRKAITKHNLVAHGWKGTTDEFRLVHVSCYRRATGAHRDPALQRT
jgi:RNA-directed DNA polymerase